jgi:hypothetical protein
MLNTLSVACILEEQCQEATVFLTASQRTLKHLDLHACLAKWGARQKHFAICSKMARKQEE